MIVRTFPHHEEVVATFELLKATWIANDPRSNVAQHFVSYHETFLDMARAVVNARYPEPAPSGSITHAEDLAKVIHDVFGSWEMASRSAEARTAAGIPNPDRERNNSRHIARAIIAAGWESPSESYIECDLTYPHDEHENSHTGAHWRDTPAPQVEVSRDSQ